MWSNLDQYLVVRLHRRVSIEMIVHVIYCGSAFIFLWLLSIKLTDVSSCSCSGVTKLFSWRDRKHDKDRRELTVADRIHSNSNFLRCDKSSNCVIKWRAKKKDIVCFACRIITMNCVTFCSTLGPNRIIPQVIP